MCIEDCFECQQTCWPVDDLLLAVRPPNTGVSCHSLKIPTSNAPLVCGNDPQPAGESQAFFSHSVVERPDDAQPVERLLQDQHEKQARREKDMGYLPGEMPGKKNDFGSMPEELIPASGNLPYEKPWYAVSD